jgi:hypothetical protein
MDLAKLRFSAFFQPISLRDARRFTPRLHDVAASWSSRFMV